MKKIILLSVIFMLTISVSIFAQTSVGPNNPGTGANVNGPGTISWSSPGNITTSGSPYASVSLTSSATSEYLQATNYGFSIPAGAAITGIEVTINRRSNTSSSSSVNDDDLYLLKGGTITGTDMALSTDWPQNFGTHTYGGTTNLWGTTWTPADINASNFGVVLSVVNQSSISTRTPDVDYITISVTYSIPPPLGVDGAVSSKTASSGNTISISHTTGTGTNRLMLVGVSWNCGTTDRTISSVTFTPNGGSALGMTQVITQLGYNSSNPRYTAIYSLLNPSGGVAGTVTVTFSGSVSNGIMAGAANFYGVDQTTPLGSSKGANGSSNAPGVTLTGLNGNELIFDNVFYGAGSSSYTLTVGANQTQLWNPDYVANLRESASTEQATSASVTMSWTASTSNYWAIAAVPIRPASGVPAMPSNNLLLGRPTNNSVGVNAIVDQSGQIYFEYGTTSGNYSAGQTGTQSVTSGVPVEVVISGLSADSKYYYRLRYRPGTSGLWAAGDEHSFHTQRAKGETFTFTIGSDSHLGQTFSGNSSDRYRQATLNIASEDPDFHFDLGDAFIVSDDLGVGGHTTGNQSEVNDVYLAQRPYFGNFSHSSPVYLVIGNHENEEGWNIDDAPFSRAIASMIARKEYFLNPVPDGFYSGNEDLLPAIGGDEYREDYYSWEWGDVLFVVLDPFQYTMTKPYGNVAGSGEENDETVSGDQWNWTLGVEQYNWLKQTLENSNAKFKFVFSHHMVGGIITVSNSSAGPPEYVRGGAVGAPYFEWGGENANGTPGYSTKRAGWDETIHQLFIDNGVSAYFHGHDHQFVYEKRDGIVYQLVPALGMTGYGFDLYDSSPYVQSGGNLPNSGHLRVTVSGNEATVGYVRSALGGDAGVTNGQVSYTYTIHPPSIKVNAKVFLQGPYSGSSMSTALNSILPKSQPYNTSPWNYTGLENVSSIPSGVVDWVLVELRTFATGAKVASRAGFIKSNGTIVDLDGTNPVAFYGKGAGNYFIVIRHRNHLSVMSKNPVALSSSGDLYDFTTSQDKAYGTNPMADLGSSVFGMISGDANGDGIVDVSDRNDTWNDRLQLGYKNSDVTLDGIVDVSDRNETWNRRLLQTRVP